MRTTLKVVAILIAVVTYAPSAMADALLTLRADGQTIELSRDAFDELETSEIKTGTNWTDGVSTFVGPLARDVIELIDNDGVETVSAVAANDYAVEIPISDFEKYNVILATEMDGKRLTLRDKGPIWIVYPRDDHPELDEPLFHGRWIWQLIRLDLK